MTENNKNHAPVAASLNLYDERAKNVPCYGASRPGELCPCADCAAWRGRVAKTMGRTPPAEVSADSLPALTRWTFDGGMTASVDQQGQWVQFKDVAPYAEQIKKLERNQLPNLADGEDEVSFPGDGKVACTTEARYWELRAAEERVAELERELVERKQVQSIGDDAEFLWLLGDWMAGLDYFQSDEHKEVKMAWARLIAYIDARPAGTAPETRSIFEYKRIGEFTVQVTFRSARACGKFIEQIAAAPSLSTGTGESK